MERKIITLAEAINIRIEAVEMSEGEHKVAFLLSSGDRLILPRPIWDGLQEFIVVNRPPPPPKPRRWDDDIDDSPTYGDIQSPPAASLRAVVREPVKDVAQPARKPEPVREVNDFNSPTKRQLRIVADIVNKHFANPNRNLEERSPEMDEAWDCLMQWPNSAFVDMYEGTRCMIESEAVRNEIVNQREADVGPLSARDTTGNNNPFMFFFRKGIPNTAVKSVAQPHVEAGMEGIEMSTMPDIAIKQRTAEVDPGFDEAMRSKEQQRERAARRALEAAQSDEEATIKRLAGEPPTKKLKSIFDR